MPIWMLRGYSAALPQLRAQRQLAAIQAAGAPYMEDSTRRQVIDELSRAISGNEEGRAVRPTFEQLRAIGIQVEEVSESGVGDER